MVLSRLLDHDCRRLRDCRQTCAEGVNVSETKRLKFKFTDQIEFDFQYLVLLLLNVSY